MDFESRFGANVASCMSIIGLDSEASEDRRRLAEALNTGGYCYVAKNDRLAVYGDAAATALLAKDWYNKGGSKGRIFGCTLPFSSLKSALAEWDQHRKERLCNDFLAEKGFAYGLDKCVNRDAGTTKVSRKMMATTMEAIFGAVHLWYGDAQLASVMRKLDVLE